MHNNYNNNNNNKNNEIIIIKTNRFLDYLRKSIGKEILLINEVAVDSALDA